MVQMQHLQVYVTVVVQVDVALSCILSLLCGSQLEEQKQLQHALFTAQQSQDAWSLGGQLLSSSNTVCRLIKAVYRATGKLRS